jgi:hypothetical protein
MDGFKVVDGEEPRASIPDGWFSKSDGPPLRVALKFVGGVGDITMAIGGTASALDGRSCFVDAFVLPHQVKYAAILSGIRKAYPVASWNEPETRFQYDVVIDFAGVLNNARSLKAKDYYELISERVGTLVKPGSYLGFTFKPQPVACVALHPGASNPNRRWPYSNWDKLAYMLASRELEVLWLGTRDDYGFNDEKCGIWKLSDYYEDLVTQTKKLATFRYFIGNDSGFAHIAGLLGVPGVVLFSSTHPDDVIARYDSLRGVHRFDLVGEPTRSLDKKDRRSLDALEALTPEDVLNATPFKDTPDKQQIKRPLPARRRKIVLVGSIPLADRLYEFLADLYDVERSKNVSENLEYDGLLVISEAGCELRTAKNVSRVNVSDFENVTRAIRERLA